MKIISWIGAVCIFFFVYIVTFIPIYIVAGVLIPNIDRWIAVNHNLLKALSFPYFAFLFVVTKIVHLKLKEYIKKKKMQRQADSSMYLYRELYGKESSSILSITFLLKKILEENGVTRLRDDALLLLANMMVVHWKKVGRKSEDDFKKDLYITLHLLFSPLNGDADSLTDMIRINFLADMYMDKGKEGEAVMCAMHIKDMIQSGRFKNEIAFTYLEECANYLEKMSNMEIDEDVKE